MSEDTSRKLYPVEVVGKYIVPESICACCMSKNGRWHTISQITTTRSTSWRATHELKATTYFCRECLEHQEAVVKKESRTLIISVLLGCIIHVLLTFLLHGNHLISFICGCASAPLLYIAISSLIKLPSLQSSHAARIDCVKVQSKDMPTGYESTGSILGGVKKPIQTIFFLFANQEYARLFQRCNPENASFAEEVPLHDTTKEMSLFQIHPKKYLTALGLGLLANGVISVIMILLFFKTNI